MMRLLLVCLACPALAAWAGEPVTVQGGYSELVFDGGPTPVSWTICERRCDDLSARRAQVFSVADGGFSATSTSLADVNDGSFSVSIERTAERVRVIADDGRDRFVYELLHGSAELRMELPEATTLELATGSAFVPEQLPGFGRIYSRVKPVTVSEDGQEVYSDALSAQSSVAITTSSDRWSGIRNRYWAWLVQPQQPAAAEFSSAGQDRPVLLLAGSRVLRIYAGPVEWQSLRAVSPELSEMLFAALWDALRALTFGMMMLYALILGGVGNHGLAIILLSLAVKILMYPLTALADRWQREVNEAHSVLQPEIDAIRRSYKGEEAHNRTLEVYRKHSISQFYTFKSAAGFLIQIPVFIAAFDMLAENFVLNQIAFLWITDLAKPDAVAALPFALPFFGAYLNLLPFLMAALSALAALLQREASLSAALQRQQSIRLYLLSAAFFVLFYTFPSGMVLYWTSSNLFHLLKVESGRFFVRK
ncbi:MAG: membrane protein insertase YidC [Gammaproteobacteria bacterium]|nr:membrane protein insertase YidC [Gammaproteobacteria bacterium]